MDLKGLLSEKDMMELLDGVKGMVGLPIFVMDRYGRPIGKGCPITGDVACSGCPKEETRVITPITIKDEMVGNLVCCEKGASYEKMEFASRIVGKLVQDEYELTNLAEEIVHSYEELNLLYELSRLIGSTFDIEKICSIVLGWARDVINANKGMMLIRESQYKDLRIVASIPHLDKDMEGMRIRFGDGVVGRAAEENKPVVLKKQDDAKGTLDLYLPPPVIAMPMVGDSGVIGVIALTKDEDFTSKEVKLVQAIATQSGIALRNLRIFDDLKAFFFSTVRALSSTIDAKDPYTEGHSERVANYSLIIGEEMGLSKEEMEVLEFSALLHDIGKLSIPIEILHKPGKLSDNEFKIVKDHPFHGVQILQKIKEFERILPGVWHHHERYMGDGYPAGLLGEEIPLAARIIAVADAFDAMIHDRPYRPAMSLKASLVELQEGAGSKYDPKVVSAFVSAFNKGKIRKEIPREEEIY